VKDADFQITGVGGGVGGHPDPEIREGGGLKKIFFALRTSVWSKN